LRTPLNSLLILSKTLADNRENNLTPDQVKFASTVHSAGQDLLALINEILDLSKVEAGKMPINPQSVLVNTVRDNLEELFRPIAKHKHLDFVVEVRPDVPPKIVTDENRLLQILNNLMSNALKFTERGQVKMTVSTAGADVRFTVTDTGIGISADKQKLIFEAFQQADGTTSRKYGGTGLGLTISREIARLLGGVIQVDSAPGRGSSFSLTLPQIYAGLSDAPEALAPPPPTPVLPDHADFSGRTVLVIDDDVRNIFALTSILKNRGMNVLFAENGRQGIDILKLNPETDVILMDTMMPEMDGLEATSLIRELPEFKDLPIISLTAKAMKGDREACLEAGASDYITKPVDEQHLLSVMYTWVQDAGSGQANAHG